MSSKSKDIHEEVKSKDGARELFGWLKSRSLGENDIDRWEFLNACLLASRDWTLCIQPTKVKEGVRIRKQQMAKTRENLKAIQTALQDPNTNQHLVMALGDIDEWSRAIYQIAKAAEKAANKLVPSTGRTPTPGEQPIYLIASAWIVYFKKKPKITSNSHFNSFIKELANQSWIPEIGDSALRGMLAKHLSK